MSENQKQFLLKGKGFKDTYTNEQKALEAFEAQKNKLLKKKESFNLQLSVRENLQSEWVVIDVVSRSANYFNED